MCRRWRGRAIRMAAKDLPCTRSDSRCEGESGTLGTADTRLMRGTVQTSSYGGHSKPHSPVTNALCNRGDTLSQSPKAPALNLFRMAADEKGHGILLTPAGVEKCDLREEPRGDKPPLKGIPYADHCQYPALYPA